MTGHGGGKGIILRKPDGTPYTRQEVIIERRGVFQWLPVLCSNDLVHGSWWFVWGSIATALTAVYPIINKEITHDIHNDDVLPATDFEITWAMLIISGVFFTLGSLAFVRAFEEPPKQPLFHNYKHFQTDELLGAWFFLFGTMPAVPYMGVFFLITPSAFYFFGTVAAAVFVLASYLFVVSCYPSDKKHENLVLPLFIRMFGPRLWVVKHLANDWMAGSWFFLWANALLTFASFVIMLVAFGVGDGQQIFIWVSGFACSFLFLGGSFYYVSGSYPHAQQFYYETGRGHISSSEETIAKMKDTKGLFEFDPTQVTNAGKNIRLSITGGLHGKQGYKGLSDHMDVPMVDHGAHDDLEVGPNTGKRTRGRKKATALASTGEDVSNPLHNAQQQGALSLSLAAPSSSGNTNAVQPGGNKSPSATGGLSTPTKAHAGDSEIPPPPPAYLPPPPPTELDGFVGDKNADDDDDDVEESHHHHHTSQLQGTFDLLNSARKAQQQQQSPPGAPNL